MNGFIRRHGPSVIGSLNGFDRVRLRGTLRWLCYAEGMGKYLSATKVLLKDFKGYALGVTDRVRRATERIAETAGRPLQYLAGSSIGQEETARRIAERDGIRQGMFKSASALAALYPRLIDHGMRSFGSREVMRFQGRKVPSHGGVHGGFTGEVVTDLRERPGGIRSKHRVNENSIKMYDKQGSVLRIETTLNNARDFREYRAKEGDRGGRKNWHVLRRGVAGIHRGAQVCRAANDGYLESSATLQDSTPLWRLAASVCRPVRRNGHRARALSPLSPDDATLLTVVNRGEFTLEGFRNRDVRARLHPKETTDPAEQRRRTSAITRQLRLLRAHGLIRKVARTHRYLLSPKGRIVINALLAAYAANTEKLVNAA